MAEYIDLDIPMKAWREWGNSYKIASTTLREFLDINKISYKVADVVPVRHGRWMEHKSWAKCSECGYLLGFESPYCPNCGARMDLED